jgi:ParB family transcriptional regulator, chromosome partitioning protein
MNKMGSRKALGRGLSNLIPVKVDDTGEKTEIYSVSIKSIKTNPFQPRCDFNDEDIRGLADSINFQGLLQPIVVRRKGDVYEIVSGERRFRAFQYLKKNTVPCIVRQDITDREMLELALIENIQREELNEIEKANAYQKLLLDYNYTHEQLSEQIGKSRTTITNSLRLLNLPDEIQSMVRKNEISMGHARALLSLKVHDQISVAKRIINEELSVREIEKIGAVNKKKKINKVVGKLKEPSNDPNINDVIERLQYKFGTSVRIQNNTNNKGKISFMFYNLDDLSRIVDLFLQ